MEGLKQYLYSKYGDGPTNDCFLRIQEIIIKTLEALQKTMASDKDNSFELYGFDIMLDSKLTPWLIEVNGSPSMTANTAKDREFKVGLMEDTLTIIDMEKLYFFLYIVFRAMRNKLAGLISSSRPKTAKIKKKGLQLYKKSVFWAQ